MKINRDIWLSDIFGYDVFKVTLSTNAECLETPDELVNDLMLTSQNKPAFYYTRIDTKHLDQMLVLNSIGFNVVDVNVIFERKLQKMVQQGKGMSLEFRDILPEDYENTLNIAASCFQYSRFHLDPQIPNKIANKIKCEWVKSYTQKRRGERLLVSLLNHNQVGFLAILKDTVNSKQTRVIDLIAVDRDYQNQGIGKSLIDFIVNDSFDKWDILRVGTQVSNIPSLRLYENCGFRISDTTYVLHAHIKNGELQK